MYSRCHPQAVRPPSTSSATHIRRCFSDEKHGILIIHFCHFCYRDLRYSSRGRSMPNRPCPLAASADELPLAKRRKQKLPSFPMCCCFRSALAERMKSWLLLCFAAAHNVWQRGKRRWLLWSFRASAAAHLLWQKKKKQPAFAKHCLRSSALAEWR